MNKIVKLHRSSQASVLRVVENPTSQKNSSGFWRRNTELLFCHAALFPLLDYWGARPEPVLQDLEYG